MFDRTEEHDPATGSVLVYVSGRFRWVLAARLSRLVREYSRHGYAVADRFTGRSETLFEQGIVSMMTDGQEHWWVAGAVMRPGA